MDDNGTYLGNIYGICNEYIKNIHKYSLNKIYDFEFSLMSGPTVDQLRNTQGKIYGTYLGNI